MTEYELELLSTGTMVNFDILASSVYARIGTEEVNVTETLMMLDEDDDKEYHTIL